MNAMAVVTAGTGLVVICFRLALEAAGRAGCRLDPGAWTWKIAAISVIGSAVIHAGSISSLLELPALSAAGVSAVTDLQAGYVFDRVLLFSASALCVIALSVGAAASAATGAFLAGGTLWTLHAVTKGAGLGLGDVKLAALLGAAAGATGALELLTVAFMVGGAVAVLLVLSGRCRRTDSMAFAPFLAVAACVVAATGRSR
jgi:leader peptidase (prepilin peptidase)/N-methyltransferase